MILFETSKYCSGVELAIVLWDQQQHLSSSCKVLLLIDSVCGVKCQENADKASRIVHQLSRSSKYMKHFEPISISIPIWIASFWSYFLVLFRRKFEGNVRFVCFYRKWYIMSSVALPEYFVQFTMSSLLPASVELWSTNMSPVAIACSGYVELKSLTNACELCNSSLSLCDAKSLDHLIRSYKTC